MNLYVIYNANLEKLQVFYMTGFGRGLTGIERKRKHPFTVMREGDIPHAAKVPCMVFVCEDIRYPYSRNGHKKTPYLSAK